MPQSSVSFLQNNFLGWFTALLIAVQLAWPFFLKWRKPSATFAAAPSFFAAMRPHFWLGYALPILAFIHAWIPMSSGHMPHTSLTGLWLATYALGLLVLQVFLGVAMRATKGLAHIVLRRIHFSAMLSIAVLLAAHIYMN
jgi:heme A synthase